MIGPPLIFVSAGWLAARIAWFVHSRPLIREPNVHWTLRADRLSRLRLGVATWYWPAILVGCVAAFAASGPLAPVNAGFAALAIVLVGVALLARDLRRIEERFGHGPRPRSSARARYFGLLASTPIWIVVGLAFFLPANPTPTELSIGLVLSLLAFVSSLGASVWVAVRLGWIATRSLAELGIDHAGTSWPFQRVLILPGRVVNAFAYVFLGQVGLGERLLAALTPEELRAVLRHEAQHLAEPRLNHWLRVLPFAVFIVLGWWRAIAAHVHPIFIILFICAYLLGASRVRRRMTQHSEDDADRAGGSESPAAYARALEKIHELNLAPVTQRKRIAHADLYDRMVAAGVTPTWARPEPAPNARKWPYVLLGIAIAIAAIAFIDFKRVPDRHRDKVNAWHVAFGGRRSAALTVLAYRAWQSNRLEESLCLYRAAAGVSEDDAFASFCVADLLLLSGRCPEAVVAADEAERRLVSRATNRLDPQWLREVRACVEECRRNTH